MQTGLFKRSLEQQLSVDIIYQSADGHISKRTISIIRMTPDSLYAYCHKRRAQRTFLLSNILSSQPTRLKHTSSLIS
ncbi:hypothetical protein [Jeotgalibacillus soli]|uniref:WYL domain-containing protein n=1 Tax=Jeotgalibacillus soli TaxID=889306 RepID=A0A0C2RVD9_9BACL|nr:hypothetical protein [Jeotgalibacillus soli]KIL45724.1 hypothetical protein KP78_20730 [Jeotgalibacillus soli]